MTDLRKLAADVVRLLVRMDYLDHVEDEAVVYGAVLDLLEGGEQADRNQDDAMPVLRNPAAPDQPHE